MKRGNGKDETVKEPQHPPIETLLAMTGETPAPGESAADRKWIEHVSSCPACTELFQELQAWRDAVRGGDAGNAPETWVRRAQERAVPRSFLAPMFGTFRADVVFDSGLRLAAGTRADALQGRQWVLAIDRLEIELSIAAAEAVETPPLSGQVLQVEGAPVTLGNCRVVMVEGERRVAETKTIETGEFLFQKRPSGSFQLRLEGDGWSIVTPVLEP